MVRSWLSRLYQAGLWGSGLCLIAIAAMVFAQISGRLLDALLKAFGLPAFGFVILSLGEIAGYLLAVATCLALAGTLQAGGHIRVTMLLGNLPERVRWYFELGVFTFAAAFSAYMTWFVARLAWDSWKFNEMSPGLVPVPLVWPQAGMAIGLALLVIALIDELIVTARDGRPSFRAAEDAVSLGKEG